MNENRLSDYLDHLHQAATDARSFVEGLAKDDFLADKRTWHAPGDAFCRHGLHLHVLASRARQGTGMTVICCRQPRPARRTSRSAGG